MTDTEKFVYVTYINTSAEALWTALTDGPTTVQYWGHANVSDWQPGSSWQHVRDDAAGTVDIAGQVVEVVPHQRLVWTWAKPSEQGDAAKTSRVTFLIEPAGDKIRLTVIHDQLETGSKMLSSISEGWPRVLSSLKTFLETGKPLITWS